MKCKVCLEDYGSEFDQDFKDGVCLPCESQAWSEKYYLDEQKELDRYNKKHGTDYDSASFYDACEKERIDFETVRRGYPKLKASHRFAQMILSEIRYDDQQRLQTTLEFESENDLPF